MNDNLKNIGAYAVFCSWGCVIRINMTIKGKKNKRVLGLIFRDVLELMKGSKYVSLSIINELRGRIYKIWKDCSLIEKINYRFLIIMLFMIYLVIFRRKINRGFLVREKEKRRDFFKKITKYELDEQQKTAVITDELNTLVVAGAGSGKTMTIAAKVKYLIEYLGIRGEEILLISFTQKSAKEMSDRIGLESVRSRTFHAFGLLVLAKVEKKMPAIIEDSEFKSFINNWFCELKKKADFSEKMGILRENIKEVEDEGSLLELIGRFLKLMRGMGVSLDSLRLKNNKRGKTEQKARECFLDLVDLMNGEYEKYLNDSEKIDFDEMISRAAEYIRKGKYKHGFKYVIVDEFQDLSISRYRIIEAIRIQNPSVKLFCVGDDWQAIYRFAGSDISLFTHFEDYFGRAEVLKIETTYRFCEPMIGISSNFVMKNPEQLEKKIKAGGSGQTGMTILNTDSWELGLRKILDEIEKRASVIGKSKDNLKIFLLGRYGFDLDKIKGDDIEKVQEMVYFGGYKMEFTTVHKSKGLEADFVILINTEGGEFGFPAVKDEGLISELLLTKENYKYEEERRLFYVAITRAKYETFLLVKRGGSKFLKEFEDTS